MIEVRIHFANFINSALDYDPEMTVLFGSSNGGSGNCDSSEYELVRDYIFWTSLSCFVLAILILSLIVCIGSTTKGREILTGREGLGKALRKLEKKTNKIQLAETPVGVVI